MAQQTAVEWLQDKLNNVKPTQFCSIDTIKEWVEQAKQMEKEQILFARMDGMLDDELSYQTAEQYYKDTYGKPNSEANA